mgnify:CR=1 FL=1
MTKRNKILSALLLCFPALMTAQTAFDIYSISQNELRGTARYVSMAGAYGALGGDLSSISLNPGGIGVYRSSDIGITIDLDIYSSKAGNSEMTKTDRFKVYANNVGYVGTKRFNSEIVPNINWGFTYNRIASFNKHYRGRISNLSTSFSNYVAGVTNSYGWTREDLAYGSTFDPYLDGSANWMSILAFDSYMMNQLSAETGFQGLYGDGTTGSAAFETHETGGINEYAFSFGGNLCNKFYWGINFGITSFDRTTTTYYGESLDNAYVVTNTGDETIREGTADYGIYNYEYLKGNGYNVKLGIIYKPIQELRLGFAFHTPTFYSFDAEYYTENEYSYANSEGTLQDFNGVNEGYNDYYSFKANTPWKFVASAAAVLGGRGIVSMDYEYTGYDTMGAEDYYGDANIGTNNDIDDYYKPSHAIKIGGELRLTNNVSVRCGYSYKTSPIENGLKNNFENVNTTLMPASYVLDDWTQHVTAGIGYRNNWFYADLAYVFRNEKSEYHAFSPVVDGFSVIEGSPSAKLYNRNNHIVISMGVRF